MKRGSHVSCSFADVPSMQLDAAAGARLRKGWNDPVSCFECVRCHTEVMWTPGGQPSEEVARGKRVPERTSALRARVARQPAMTLRPAAVIFTTNICVAPPPTLRVGELLTKLLYLWVAG
jgi:hypothetical protein